MPPPALDADDERHPRYDPRYARLAPEELPLDRVPEGHGRARPALLGRSRARVRRASACSIAAHGNSLRALVKYLDGISDEEIVGLNIPTGIPLVYELDDDLRRSATTTSATRGAQARGRRGREAGEWGTR